MAFDVMRRFVPFFFRFFPMHILGVGGLHLRSFFSAWSRGVVIDIQDTCFLSTSF
jgi:hypothetical protein